MTSTLAPITFTLQPSTIGGRARWVVYWRGENGKDARIGLVTWVDAWNEYAFYQAGLQALPAEAMREVARFLEEQK